MPDPDGMALKRTTDVSKRPLTSAKMYELARGAGWTGQNIDIAVAVARAESSWIPSNISPTQDYGLWQINKAAHGSQYDFDRLLTDYAYNAMAAYNISGKGTHWSAWTAYNSGAYRKYLTATAELGMDAPPPAGGGGGAGGGNPSADWSALYKGSSLNAPSQSAFDPNSNYPSGPFASAATKGQIIGMTEPAIGYVVRFLYNPSSLTFDYSVDTNIKDPQQQDLSQMRVRLPQGTSTSIGFQLYFDRTFECRKGSQVGVLSDIHALEWVCGITDHFPFMMPNRVKLMFGAPNQLIWYASITGITVEMTHFNSAMIPMRCIVNVKALRMAKEDFGGKDDPTLNPPAPTAWEKAVGVTSTGTTTTTTTRPSTGMADVLTAANQ
jgi:hypothetical protein